jgi:hypothetical protein
MSSLLYKDQGGPFGSAFPASGGGGLMGPGGARGTPAVALKRSPADDAPWRVVRALLAVRQP